MGWTIGTSAPENPRLTDKFFSCLGRALYLATEFEHKCGFILQISTIAKRAEDAADSQLNMEELFAPALRGHAMLGPALNALKAHGRMQLDHLQLLDAGRRARNYIAHQAGMLGALHSVRTEAIESALNALRERVDVLAKADAVVSEWIFYIENKESNVPRWLKANYSDAIVKWVMSGRGDQLRLAQVQYERRILQSHADWRQNAMNCPCCDGERKLREIVGGLIGCGYGHEFTLTEQGSARAITPTGATELPRGSRIGTLAVPEGTMFKWRIEP